MCALDANRDRFEIALLTPPGRGAIASIHCAGRGAEAALARYLILPASRTVGALALGQIVHGRWSAPEGEEIVACRRAEHEFVIHCHGGNAAVERIVEDLSIAGGQVAGRDALARRSGDSLETAALIALAATRTERAANILLDQWHGALRGELQGALAELQAGEIALARKRLRRLADRGEVGRHLTLPYDVVLAGRPNVGKSSLINALVGYQRALVFDQPGTTRDVVTAETAIDGWTVRLSDTAGLRDSHDVLEAAGISRTRARLQKCDLIVLVMDASQPRSADDERLLAEWPAALVAASKCDLPASRSDNGQAALVRTSALTGEGIAELLAAISRRLVPSPPAPGAGVPFTAAQTQAVARALCALEASDVVLASEVLLALMAGARDESTLS